MRKPKRLGKTGRLRGMATYVLIMASRNYRIRGKASKVCRNQSVLGVMAGEFAVPAFPLIENGGQAMLNINGLKEKRQNLIGKYDGADVVQSEGIRDERNKLAKERDALGAERQERQLHGMERAKVSGKMRKLQRKVDALNKGLKGLPPSPMDPIDVVDNTMGRLCEFVDGFQKNVAEFVKTISDSPYRTSDEMAWKMEHLVKDEWRAGESKLILKVLGDDEDRAGYQDFVTLLELFETRYMELIEEHLHSWEPQMQSTGMAHNAVALFQHQARADFINVLEWKIQELNEYFGNVQSWMAIGV